MTTYIPSLTLPAAIFANPAASILLPISLGTAVTLSVKPKQSQKSYKALKQLPYNPPTQILRPTWALLYGLMGYSAYRVYSTGMSPFASAEKRLLTKQGATLYTIQLGLNLLWAPLFFIAKRPIEATVEIVALTGISSYLAYIWGKVDPVAGWCVVPYLGWLGFATYLSAGVGYVNNWDLNGKEIESPPSPKSEET